MRSSLPTVLALASLGVSPLAGQASTERKTHSIPHALEVMAKVIDQPMPAGLSGGEARSYAAQTEWLKGIRTRLEHIANKAETQKSREAQTGMATGRRQHGPIDVRREIEGLQKTFDQEGRKFTALSNIMKTRHETVKNAIQNLKA